MKKKIYLPIIAILIFLIGILPRIPLTSALTNEDIATKDTYVDTGNPTSNYGGVDILQAGFNILSDIKEAYFYFEFSNRPNNFTKAEISLDFWGVLQTMNFTVCLIEENWNEYSVTWIDKPDKGAVIDNLLVISNDIYKLDVTSLIEGRTFLSICVYIDVENYIEDYAYINSREGYFWEEDAPQLIWTYSIIDNLRIYGYDMLILMGSIVGISVISIKKRKI